MPCANLPIKNNKIINIVKIGNYFAFRPNNPAIIPLNDSINAITIIDLFLNLLLNSFCFLAPNCT